MLRKTTMRRAGAEAVAIFVFGRLLAMVPMRVWPFWLVPLLMLARVATFIVPPVWAALRVKSTRREKMSRRFWRLGPALAGCCTLADVLIALVIGESFFLGGLAGAPDLARFFTAGRAHLSPLEFAVGALIRFMLLAAYYTIAVVCTRLANGGFLRFTMPAGKGRVTL